MVLRNMRFYRVKNIGFVALICGVSLTANADDFDREGVRGDTYCFPAKFVVKTIESLEDLSPEKKDVVSITFTPQFKIYDGGGLPDRYFLRVNAEGSAVADSQTENSQAQKSETDFTILSDGRVPDFIEKSKSANKDADVCITDRARAGLDADDESLYFEMGLTPYFKNHSGFHTLSELKEGAKDGKSHYKKMIPAVARMFMPSTDHLHIRYRQIMETPLILARIGDKDVPLETRPYNEGFVIDRQTLEDLDAQGLVIKGGAYDLSPVPSIATMKKYGIGKPRGPDAE